MSGRKGFVQVRGTDHYALEIDGQIWRSESSADVIYACNFRTANLVKAGAEVASTFKEYPVPVELSSTRYGRSVTMTKYRRRGSR